MSKQELHYVSELKKSDFLDEIFNSISIKINDIGTAVDRYVNNKKDYVVTVDFEFVYVTTGLLEICIDNKTILCKKGDLCLIPPFAVRQIDAKIDYSEYHWIHFEITPMYLTKKFLNTILTNDDFFIQSNNIYNITQVFEKIKNEYKGNTLLSRTYVDLMFSTFIVDLLRNKYNFKPIPRDDTTTLLPSEKLLITNATEYIDKNLDKNLSIPNLANHLNVSESWFYKTFIKVVNLSPNKYIQLAKARSAYLLVQASEVPLNEIAERLGFKDYFYFSKFYKKWYKISPRENRKTI